MRFTTRADISAPIDYVFEEVSDFERFERMALRRGAKVTREEDAGRSDIGTKWDAEIDFRGRRRTIHLEITSFDPPNGFIVGSKTGGLSGSLIIDLVALSKWRTRIGVDFDLKPHTMPARILLQSMKLGKGGLKRRFQDRVLEFAQDIELGYRGVSDQSRR